jgi:phage protein D
MKKFVKNYIGKGKSVQGLQIVRVTCKLEDLQKFAYESHDVEYVTFEVAKMKQTDAFGRDYTVCVSQEEEEEEAPEDQTKKADKSPSRKPAKKHEKIVAEPATRQIREFNNEVVVIAQTAFAQSGDREKSIEAGCNDYISKPINKAELLALIHRNFNI